MSKMYVLCIMANAKKVNMLNKEKAVDYSR